MEITQEQWNNLDKALNPGRTWGQFIEQELVEPIRRREELALKIARGYMHALDQYDDETREMWMFDLGYSVPYYMGMCEEAGEDVDVEVSRVTDKVNRMIAGEIEKGMPV